MALDPLMFRWFDRDAILCTDELATYNWFGGKMRRHMRVTHSAGQYAKTESGVRVHVNTAEGFFGLFKMALVGIHHAVSACTCTATSLSRPSDRTGVATTLASGLRAA